MSKLATSPSNSAGRTCGRPIRNWIDQLEGQGCLAREEGEYPTLALTEHGRRVLRGEADVRLFKTAAKGPREAGGRAARRAERAGAPYTAPDADLFETLRALRRTMAEERGIPPYLIFSDATLRELARERPTTEAEFLAIKGVGQHKLAELGPRFLACIRSHLTPSPEDPPRGPL